MHARLTQALSLMIAALGVAIVVVTATRGGGSVGYLLGPLFVLAGLGRIYLARSR